MPKTPRTPAPGRAPKGFGAVPSPAASVDRAAMAAALDAAAAARREAQTNWGPHLEGGNAVPPGYRIRGTSICQVEKDADGHTRIVWRKTTEDRNDPFALAQAVGAGLASVGLTALPEIAAPEHSTDDLLAVYPLGDPHIGMHAWAAEVGEAFDLDIATRQYLAVAGLLFPRAPVGSDALLIDLGDFFHFDDQLYRTSSGRHTMDADSRLDKVLTRGCEIMATLVDAALIQHRNVTVWCVRGNHDHQASQVVRQYLRGRYERNPRVTIDMTPGKFHYMEYGANLLGATHGDALKGRRGRTLHEIMTSDQRPAWGRTTHAKWYVGHVHHDSVEEVGGCIVQTYRTLAPKDAWHHASGYRAGRDTRLELVHREHGFVQDVRIPISEVHAAMREQGWEP